MEFLTYGSKVSKHFPVRKEKQRNNRKTTQADASAKSDTSACQSEFKIGLQGLYIFYKSIPAVLSY